MAEEYWKKQIIPYLPPQLKDMMAALAEPGVEEIRLRAGRPVIVQAAGREITPAGSAVTGAAELLSVLLMMTEHSLYARDEELRRGYLALPGGHRVGFAGRTVVEDGAVKLLRDISGINIRIARQVRGVGEKVLPSIYSAAEQRVRHTLIISLPQGGKTTLLRDLTRLLSNGDQAAARPGLKVGVVDERSEIAGCFAGQPQLDVGLRTDVLDGCPKAEGMMMLIRSMSPQLVVTDELGRPEDVRAVEEVISSGAAVLATAHAGSVEEILRRPGLSALVAGRLFERVIVLSRRNGPGTVESVLGVGEPGKRQHDGGWRHVG